MKVVDAGYEILTPINGHELEMIERAGRTCYKSEDKITKESAKKFVGGLIKNHHEAMLEHSSLTVKFICDRGISHEIVRHRVASFAQESTRYCNYSNEKFGNELTFIKPFYMKDNQRLLENWERCMAECEQAYFALLKDGCTPQEARCVLPNSLKTELVMTANYREWRHFLKLRAVEVTGPVHPQMKEITVPLLKELNEKIPVIFSDLVSDCAAAYDNHLLYARVIGYNDEQLYNWCKNFQKEN